MEAETVLTGVSSNIYRVCCLNIDTLNVESFRLLFLVVRPMTVKIDTSFLIHQTIPTLLQAWRLNVRRKYASLIIVQDSQSEWTILKFDSYFRFHDHLILQEHDDTTVRNWQKYVMRNYRNRFHGSTMTNS